MNELYALLPRVNRAAFLARLRAQPNFDFKAGPNHSPLAHWLRIAISDGAAPAAQQLLVDILRQLAEHTGITYYSMRDQATMVLREYLPTLGIEVPDVPMHGGRRRKTARRVKAPARRAKSLRRNRIARK